MCKWYNVTVHSFHPVCTFALLIKALHQGCPIWPGTDYFWLVTHAWISNVLNYYYFPAVTYVACMIRTTRASVVVNLLGVRRVYCPLPPAAQLQSSELQRASVPWAMATMQATAMVPTTATVLMALSALSLPEPLPLSVPAESFGRDFWQTRALEGRLVCRVAREYCMAGWEEQGDWAMATTLHYSASSGMVQIL